MYGLTKKQKKILNNYQHVPKIEELPSGVYRKLEEINDWERIYQEVDMYLWDNFDPKKEGTKREELPTDHIATIELSAKGVQQEHGISFEDACWVVDKMRDSNETNESLSFSEGYFVDEVKGKNEGRNR